MNYNRLVPGTIRSALSGERPIIRSDGAYVRDYFYIKDAVAAYLRLAEQLPGEYCVGQAFNFGAEEPASVMEVVRLVLRLCGRDDLEPYVLNEATNEIPSQYLDCAKARRTLGWEAAYPLEAGLRETIAWYRSHLTLPSDVPKA